MTDDDKRESRTRSPFVIAIHELLDEEPVRSLRILVWDSLVMYVWRLWWPA